MRKNPKPVLVPSPVSVPTPARVALTHGDAKYYVCPAALGRAMNCGQRLPMYAGPYCDEPVQIMPGALIQVAQLAAT